MLLLYFFGCTSPFLCSSSEDMLVMQIICQLQYKDQSFSKMRKNITNGQFKLDYNHQDQIGEDVKLSRMPTTDSFEMLRNDNQSSEPQFYIENIRSGSFSQISENYMIESVKVKDASNDFTTDSFDVEMKMIIGGFRGKLNKITTFFQGLFAGMALLYTVTLNLSTSLSTDLVRVEDQAIRIVSLLSAFGAMYSLMLSKQIYDQTMIYGTASQIDQIYKSLILSTIQLICYLISYVIFNISHQFTVNYNILSTSYDSLKSATTAYTAICLLGWIFTNINTYKYED